MLPTEAPSTPVTTASPSVVRVISPVDLLREALMPPLPVAEIVMLPTDLDNEPCVVLVASPRTVRLANPVTPFAWKSLIAAADNPMSPIDLDNVPPDSEVPVDENVILPTDWDNVPEAGELPVAVNPSVFSVLVSVPVLLTVAVELDVRLTRGRVAAPVTVEVPVVERVSVPTD